MWLQNVNALVMQKRTDRKPGEWKEKADQAGSTYFVVSVLVVGSLRPLKTLSHNRIAKPLINTLSRVQRWSAAFDYSLPGAQLGESLARCNAFQEDLRSYNLLFPPAKLAD